MPRAMNGVERKQQESAEAFQRAAEAAAGGRSADARRYLAEGELARDVAARMSE